MNTHDRSAKKSTNTSKNNVPEDRQQDGNVSGLDSFYTMRRAIQKPSRETLTPNAVLQLQRTIGNNAIIKMLNPTQTRQTKKIQRVERGELNTGTWVKFQSMTVLKGNQWVDPGTLAVVLEVPGKGDVKVKIKEGTYDGKITTMPPKWLDLDPNGADKNLIRNRNDALKLIDKNAGLFGVDATQEIKTSINSPEKIDQAQFNFCGPNDFLMAIAMRDPISYVNYLIDLYKAKEELDKSGNLVNNMTAQLGKMSVGLNQDVIEQDPNNFTSTAITDISKTDWMSMGSIRTDTTAKAPTSNDPEVLVILQEFQTNGVPGALNKAAGKSDKLQQAIMLIKKGLVQRGNTIPSLAKAPQIQQSAIDVLRKIGEGAMPYEVENWFNQYGATNVVQDADPFTPNKTDVDIGNANARLDPSGGKMVMVNIDARVLQGGHYGLSYDPTKSHWVLLKTPLVKVNDSAGDRWECKVYSWGSVHTMKIADAKIAASFFGYVAATINTPY